jgi:carbonic anhydrase
MCLHDEQSRREWMRLAGLAAAGAVVGSAGRWAIAADATIADPRNGMTGTDALTKLLAGNERFVAGQPKSPRRRPEDFAPLAAGQFPLAAIIACSDSRVAPEIMFDQGVGDLFVIRVAGNVIGGSGPVVKGSIEYAVAVLNVPLVMVLGHSNCGAVDAAIKHFDDHDALPGAINGLVDLIKPAVEEVRGKPGDKLTNAIRANVELGVERLKGLEPILAGPVHAGKVKVVGATYDLATGRVEMVG